MVLSNLGDSDLITSYINGNEKAFETLLLRHKDRVYRYIYSKLKDSQLSNDVFQDTFVKVVNTIKLGNYNEEGKFLPWVMRITHNLIIDHFRRSNRMPTFNSTDDFDIFSVLGDDKLNAENQLIKDQILNDVKELVKELPEEQKEVLIMRIYKDMSFKEISENTGVSINTALGRMRYALINLRKLVEKHKIILVN